MTEVSVGTGVNNTQNLFSGAVLIPVLPMFLEASELALLIMVLELFWMPEIFIRKGRGSYTVPNVVHHRSQQMFGCPVSPVLDLQPCIRG